MSASRYLTDSIILLLVVRRIKVYADIFNFVRITKEIFNAVKTQKMLTEYLQKSRKKTIDYINSSDCEYIQIKRFLDFCNANPDTFGIGQVVNEKFEIFFKSVVSAIWNNRESVVNRGYHYSDWANLCVVTSRWLPAEFVSENVAVKTGRDDRRIECRKGFTKLHGYFQVRYDDEVEESEFISIIKKSKYVWTKCEYISLMEFFSGDHPTQYYFSILVNNEDELKEALRELHL
jgi:hypothetical protein